MVVELNPQESRVNRMAVFVSGRGSNLQALLDQEGCNIRLVCSHRSILPADLKAKRSFIPVYKTRKIDFDQWAEVLKMFRVKRIFLLGFMRLIPESFVQIWKNKIINIHPSLLPLFPGLEAISKSFTEKTKMGVTIHKVITQMDAGDVVAQSQVISAHRGNISFQTVLLMMTFREHYLVRRVGEKWN